MAPPPLADLGFPAWLRAAHWINVFFIGLLLRSGIQVLSSYPRLYWGYDAVPGREWIKFTRKKIPTDRHWITLDQETNAPPWLAQPGGKLLGLGRHWHFASVIFWVPNGVIYVFLLFATGQWQRLIPTSWSIFPEAWNAIVIYATLHIPPHRPPYPYDAVQQLVYAAVVFLLGPFLILTGAAQSPAIAGRFPWYERLFGGRQTARSLHFLGLLAVVAFTLAHTWMVIYTGFAQNISNITLGTGAHDLGLAVAIGLAIIVACLLIYAVTTWASLRSPRRVYEALGALIHPPLGWLAHRTAPRQRYHRSEISPVFLVNGEPPTSERYELMKALGYADYHLEICGLVKHPLLLSYAQLRAMPRHEQITLHHCIQGWSSIGAWAGVSFTDILELCEPKPTAQHVVFWSHSNDTSGRQFYEVIDLATLRHPQTLLAYQLNDVDLTVEHGAPLRLRAETLLGFKMVKWIERIEFVEEYASIRGGQGGSREDNKEYEMEASV